MCTEQTTEARHSWLQDPLIRLVMDSDHVSDGEMLALLRRVSVAFASRRDSGPLTPAR